MEAILERAALEMDDFVEVRSFGVKGMPEILRFPGRPYDGCDNRHVEAFGTDGLGALLELRKRYQHSISEAGVLTNPADPARWQLFRQLLGNPPLPQVNYAPNKGWGEALESFCRAIAGGGIPENADASDGARAVACAKAGRRSIETARPIDLDSTGWRLR